MSTTLSNETVDLIQGALGTPEARIELVDAVESGANSLDNIIAGTNITTSLVNGQLTINASGGGGGASTALDNLTSPTAINQNLMPDTDSTYMLGDNNNKWAQISTSSLIAYGVVAADYIQLDGSVSGALSISPAATTTNYSISLPAAQGGANTTLQNDGSGNLTWVSGGGGANTSLSNLNTNISLNSSQIKVLTDVVIEDALVSNWWGSSTRSLTLDSDTIVGPDASTTFVIGSRDTAIQPNTVGTLIQSGAVTKIDGTYTGDINIISGDLSGASSTGKTGDIYSSTGNSANGTANSGSQIIYTGNSNANSGDITIATGSASGTRGKVSVDSRTIELTGAIALPPIPQTLTAGGTIISSRSFVQIDAGSPLSTSTSTVIAAGLVDGQILQLVNVGPNSITLKTGGNTELPSVADYVLTASSSIAFIWTGSTWYTTSFSVN